MTTNAPPVPDYAGLDRLGVGGAEDRLHFRLVIGVLTRCLRLLRPVRMHIFGLIAGYSVLAVIALPIVVLLIDSLWSRALQGQALTALEAAFLGLDAARFVEVPELSQELRRIVGRSVISRSALIAVPLFPAIVGLIYYQIWLLQRVNQQLRVELMEAFQSLSLRFHADNQVGDALYRLNQDSAMVTRLIDVLVMQPIWAISRFIMATVVVAFFDPGFALVLLLMWPPCLAIGYYTSRRMRVRFRRARETNSTLTSRIQETLAGIKVIKAYGAEWVEQERFEESSREAFRAAFSARNFYATYKIVVFWCIGAAIITLTAMASLDARDGTALTVTAAGFTAWNLGLYNAFKWNLDGGSGATRSLFTTWGRIQDVSIGLDRVFEVMDTEPEVVDRDDAVPLDGVARGIAFRDVTFAYQSDRPVLDRVNLEARVGAVTAIVGPTGSGKSTLMALLLRLFEPSSGRIEIDGVDISGFTVESVRDRVAIALQENILFGDTVRENIRFAVPTASDADVREAARVACADGFIEQLEQGYDTPLGERGSKLSTGQRQRLSIARALVKDTPILVLDEPTASLDAETEFSVLRNLAQWGRERAIFLITHRLSTIRRADQIAFLEGGRIIEAGSHEELMAREGGAYRALVEAEQARASAPPPAPAALEEGIVA